MSHPSSELRWDPLERRWALIAPGRSQRPLDFKPTPRPVVDRTTTPCPFCLILTGQETQTQIAERRVRDATEPHLDEDVVLVLANRFPILSIDTPPTRTTMGPYVSMSGVGAHEVVVETAKHGLTLRAMSDTQRQHVLSMWRDRADDLTRDHRIAHVQIFKNEGPKAGASLEHSHSQVVASPICPPRIERQLDAARAHYHATQRCLTCDMLDVEAQPHTGHRLVDSEGPFIAWCPYASARPFEVHIAPKAHTARFTLSDDEALSLSKLLGRVLRALDVALAGADINLVFDLPPSPTRLDDLVAASWHWRLELLPRLLPYGGFELGTDIHINPTAPEDAAARLRALVATGPRPAVPT